MIKLEKRQTWATFCFTRKSQGSRRVRGRRGDGKARERPAPEGPGAAGSHERPPARVGASRPRAERPLQAGRSSAGSTRTAHAARVAAGTESTRGNTHGGSPREKVDNRWVEVRGAGTFTAPSWPPPRGFEELHTKSVKSMFNDLAAGPGTGRPLVAAVLRHRSARRPGAGRPRDPPGPPAPPALLPRLYPARDNGPGESAAPAIAAPGPLTPGPRRAGQGDYFSIQIQGRKHLDAALPRSASHFVMKRAREKSDGFTQGPAGTPVKH